MRNLTSTTFAGSCLESARRTPERFVRLILLSSFLIVSVPATAALNDCGQPVSPGDTPTASDALFVLGTAIGLQTCEFCVCDVDASGSITASDALTTLSAAVGGSAVLACESCGDPPALDCVKEGYPCTFADVTPAAIDKIFELLPQIWDVRNAGTMEDVKNFLAAHPDVTDVYGNDVLIRFAIDGMVPAFFQDPTVYLPQASTIASTPETAHEVVGEDSSGDGEVDNRDRKRALVLAPFEWKFSPDDDSPAVAERLRGDGPYKADVTFKRNASRDDQNISIEDFLGFDNYDAIFISTHGARACQTLPDMTESCMIGISTHIIWDRQDPPPVSITGLGIAGYFDPEEEQSQTQIYLALTTDFWRGIYGGGLKKLFVNFSACETGRNEGREMAAAMGGENFVMMGWSEVTDVDKASDVTEFFIEQLFKGVTAEKARDLVEEAGLTPYRNSQFVETDFEHFAPGNSSVRIVELPRLIHAGATMREGMNISELVIGTVGDGDPDELKLTVQVDGVTEDDIGQFSVRYRVDDQDTPGFFTLSTASLVPGFEYRYEVTHTVDLGFPLSIGPLPLDVIVDLPEDGDSRFHVDVSLASCSFDATVTGDTSAFFDGPAQATVADDGSLAISLRSRGFINADIDRSVLGGFTTVPGIPLEPGTYPIEQAFFSIAAAGYNGQYFAGLENFDCGTCGGTVTIASVEGESVSGTASVTMPRVTPVPDNPPGPPLTMDVDFIAAFGSQFAGSSPYVRCSIEYAED